MRLGRKRVGRRFLCLLCLAEALLLGLTGCGENSLPPLSSLTLPTAFVQAGAASPAERPAGKMVLFIDNTQSMAGYVRNQSGKYGYSDDRMNQFLISLKQLSKTNSASLMTLQPDGKGLLGWAEAGPNTLEHFGMQTFYTDLKTTRLPEGQGPLNLLYYSELLNSDNVNVIITDLEEQNLNNIDLAIKIHKDAMAVDGQSIALLVLNTSFHGTIYHPASELYTNLKNDYYDGERPLYVIFSGPDSQLVKVMGQFTEILQEHGLNGERADYRLTLYRPGLGVCSVEHGAFKTAETAKYMKISAGEWMQEDVNLNLGVERKSLTELGVFGEDVSAPDVDGYRYLSVGEDETKSRRLLLHYFLPIGLEEGAPSYAPESTEEDGRNPVDLTHIRFRLAEGDCTGTQLWYPERTDPVDPLLPVESAVSGAEAAASSGQSSEAESAPAYEWKTLSDPAEIGKLFHIEAKRVGKGEVLQAIGGKGETAFTADTDYLHITIAANAAPPELPGEVMLVNLPVYASYGHPDTVPEWVSQYESDSSSGEGSYDGSRTKNFIAFYKYLFGIGYAGEPGAESNETCIANIKLAISGLPSDQGK